MSTTENKQTKLIVGLDKLYVINVNDVDNEDEIRQALINMILSDISNIQVEIVEEII